MRLQTDRVGGIAASGVDALAASSSDPGIHELSALRGCYMADNILEPHTGTVRQAAFLVTVLLDQSALRGVDGPLAVVPWSIRRSAREVPNALAVEEDDDLSLIHI